MAEQRSSRPGEPKGTRPPSESHLRLVGADGQVVFDDARSDTDESPTIISKNARSPEPAEVSGDGASIRGRKLAHYELIEPIGVGGMAAVLRARDTQLDRIVALKILPPPMAKDPENIRRFHQEARAAAKLDHENIARVFFCGEDQGLHFIAFEYVEGENLRVILERRGRLSVAESIRYVLQVATGLEHAASRNVVHRDVKPSNIIITPTGRAKLVDMGLARSLEPHEDNGLTQSGVTLGTFDYISPEQALEPRDADCRSDLYSLGCTFYHALTGQAPVPEGTATKKLRHHLDVAPTDPRQINPEIPDEVAFVVGKLMAKNPRERYQRPALLVQHLMQIAQKYGAAQDLPEPLFVDVNLPTDPAHRPLVLVSIAALLLAGLLFLLSLVPGEPRHPVDGPTPPRPANPEPVANVTPPLPTLTSSGIIHNEKDLIAALEKGASTPGEKLTLVLEGPIALQGGLSIGDVVKAPNYVELTAVKPSATQAGPTQFLFAPSGNKVEFGLRIVGKRTVSFKGIGFDVGPHRAEDVTNRFPAAGVVVAAPATAIFERCKFAQHKLPLTTKFIKHPEEFPVASVSLESTKESKWLPDVAFRECFFASGQAGVSLFGPGSSWAKLFDCGFADVSTLFHARGGRPWIQLEHCSAFLRNGPAFRIDGDTSPTIRVETSLFSTPKDAERLGDENNLIHQVGADGDPARIRYSSNGGNGYQNLKNLWVTRNGSLIYYELDPFRIALAGPDRNPKTIDPKSLVLSPEVPIFRGESTSSDVEPRPVDQFDTTQGIRELVYLSKPADSDGYPGLRKMLGESARPIQFDPAPMGPAEYQPGENETVVDGSVDDRDEKLRISATKPVQVFLLKPGPEKQKFKLHNADVGTNVTIRPYPGADMPVVTIDEKFYLESSMFHLLSGSLTLERLQLELDPGDNRFSGQSVAIMAGSGTLTLKDCLITLKGQARAGDKMPTPLSVVTLQSADEMKKMMLTPAGSTPRIVLQNCTVRGEGDLVVLRASRPLDMQLEKSLVYLQGSLLQQQQGALLPQGATREPAVADGISIRFDRSAILTEAAMLQIRSGKSGMRYQHPLHVESTSTLFARLGDQPLVLLDLPDVMDTNVKQKLDWKGQQGQQGDPSDVFANFGGDAILSEAPNENGIAAQLSDRDWHENYYSKTEDPSQLFPVGTIHPGPDRLSKIDPDNLFAPSELAEALMPYFTAAGLKRTKNP